MEAKERLSKAAYYLDNWGDAVRGSWAEFDGRSAKSQLRSLSEYMRDYDGEDYDPFADLICYLGGYPHWMHSAYDHECDP
jgi:hypothetical protein